MPVSRAHCSKSRVRRIAEMRIGRRNGLSELGSAHERTWARKAGAQAPLNTPPRHAACPDARGPLCQAPHLQFRAIASSGHTWVLSGDDPGLLAQVLGPRRPGAANSPPEVCHRICRTAHEPRSNDLSRLAYTHDARYKLQIRKKDRDRPTQSDYRPQAGPPTTPLSPHNITTADIEGGPIVSSSIADHL